MRGISTSEKYVNADLFTLLAQTDVNVLRVGFSKDSTNPPTPQNPLIPYTNHLAILDAALPLARAAGIKIILCPADIYGRNLENVWQDPGNRTIFRNHLTALWTALAERYLDEPAIAAYDILNEPQTGSDAGWYGDVLPASVAAIRQVNSNIWLVIEPANWGLPAGFNTLPVSNDPRVIYSFHHYAPHSYVHQGILGYVGYSATYPGSNSMWGTAPYTYWDKETLRATMQPVIAFAQANNARILVGEFGVLRWAPGAEHWLADSIALFEEYGWDWCHHSLGGWNGFSSTYSTNTQSTSQLADGGDRGARWTVLSNNWALNASIQSETPTAVSLDLRLGTQISWTASSTNSYQPQKSADNSNWTDCGALLAGNTVTSRFDAANSPFYRVLELTPSIGLVLNSGFEFGSGTNASNWSATTAAGGPVYGVRTNNSPRSGSYHFEVHLASTGGGPVVEFRQSGVPVTGGTTYPFSFYVKALTGSSGHNPQWKILWNVGGETAYQGFTAGNNVYSLVSNAVAAPLAATSATLILRAAGAASASQSATLQFDDVTFGSGGGLPGATNVICATVQPALELSWPTQTGSDYQVKSSTSLNSFTNFGPLIRGDGNRAKVIDLRMSPAKFYRLERSQSP